MKNILLAVVIFLLSQAAFSVDTASYAQKNTVDDDPSKGRFSSTCPRNHPNYPNCGSGVVTFSVTPLETNADEGDEEEASSESDN